MSGGQETFHLPLADTPTQHHSLNAGPRGRQAKLTRFDAQVLVPSPNRLAAEPSATTQPVGAVPSLTLRQLLLQTHTFLCYTMNRSLIVCELVGLSFPGL